MTVSGYQQHLEHNADSDTALRQIRTAGSISISPELFEKLYLTPKTPRHGNNVKRFANAVPMGFTGFVISTFTFSMILMGFGAASIFTTTSIATQNAVEFRDLGVAPGEQVYVKPRKATVFVEDYSI